MNLPNKLSLLRILLTFLIMGLLFVPGALVKALCLALFLLASATDWWDGALARRLNQVTPLGALLDPIADKVLALGLFLTFVQLGLIRAWMVLVIALREFLITAVRLFAASRHVVIPAAQEGKHKTISQMLTILVGLVLLVLRDLLTGPLAEVFARWWRPVMLWWMWMTVVLTVISGTSFFWRNRAVLADVSR